MKENYGAFGEKLNLVSNLLNQCIHMFDQRIAKKQMKKKKLNLVADMMQPELSLKENTKISNELLKEIRKRFDQIQLSSAGE